MKVEAIIAHRGEVPENLHRTYYNLRRHGVEVRLVEDGPQPQGCGYRRHEGIEASRADVVFLADAHMAFDDDCVPAFKEHLRERPADLTVHRMRSINHDWTVTGGAPYFAAEIQVNVKTDGGQYWPLAARWRKEDTGNGPVGAVMGACYAMRRDRYMETMGQPLSVLQAWGCDEELLSIACWITGGEVHLVPGMAEHMYAAPRAWKLTEAEACRIWANRVNLIESLPAAEEQWEEMLDWLLRTPYVQEHADSIFEAACRRSVEVARLENALAAGPMSWDHYRVAHCKPFDGDRREGLLATDKAREVDIPPPQTPKRQYIQAPRVVDWGVACPHCGHRYDHGVTNTWPNGNRRVLCGSCKYPFTVFRMSA
jgi:hypothetical protein